MKEQFFGIVVYSICEDGCLNGLWTNIGDEKTSDKRGQIWNEIAKKNDDTLGLAGKYTDTYIGDSNDPHIGTLEIKQPDETNYYELDWLDSDKKIFKGKGFKFDKQLIVSYWQTA